MSGTAREELTELVKSTDSMRQIYEDLRREPLRLFCQICGESKHTGRPVPDHRLALFNYFAEASLRALAAAGLLKQIQGSSFSIYEYEPTERGLAMYRKLEAEGYCKS